MLPAIIGLCLFYLGTKLLVRWWWYRPSYARPGFLRHNETVSTFDLFAVVALLATFFLLVNFAGLLVAILLTVLLLAYDFGLRALFLHRETKRVCTESRKWTYREARRRVRQRARGPAPL